jgi:sialate O-acetylesterase
MTQIKFRYAVTLSQSSSPQSLSVRSLVSGRGRCGYNGSGNSSPQSLFVRGLVCGKGLCVWLCLLLSMAASAQVKLPAIISDNMILQSGMPVPIWGTALPGEKIRIQFRDKTFTTTAGADSNWLVKLDSYKPGGPFTMQITGDREEKAIANIWIGEVWLASGQSNMEFGIQKDSAAAETIPYAKDSLIHFFYVPMAHALTRQKDIPTPQANRPMDGKWIVCSPEALASKWAWNGFSAVGYYFAKQIRASTGSPVGMIGSYKGATPAQAWVSVEGLQQDTALARHIARRQTLLNSHENGGYSGPANLFHAMIAPLIPYAIKGVIWYQGESNGDRLNDALEYKVLFPRLIKDWRQQWKQGDFPFLFVQLTSHHALAQTPAEGIWPWVREAQLKTLSLPNTGMAVIMDAGNATDIHPKEKKPVGERLALAARKIAYQQNIVYTGPVYQSMKIRGNKIILRFSTGGLQTRPPHGPVQAMLPPDGFGIAGEDRKFVWAQAQIKGNTVIVHSDEVRKPVVVRYSWGDNPRGNLFNDSGLPASPFRTDNWPAK